MVEWFYGRDVPLANGTWRQNTIATRRNSEISSSGDRGGGEQAGGFIETTHYVQVLDRLSRGALAQVVDRRDHDERLRAAVEDEGHLAEIGRAHVAQLR